MIEFLVTRDKDGEFISLDVSVGEPEKEGGIHRVRKGLRYTSFGSDVSPDLEGVTMDEVLGFLNFEYLGNERGISKYTDYEHELWRDLDYVAPLSQEGADLPVTAGVVVQTTPGMVGGLIIGSQPNSALQTLAREGSGEGSDPVFAPPAEVARCVGCGTEQGLLNATIPNPLMQNNPIKVYVCIKCFNPATNGSFNVNGK